MSDEISSFVSSRQTSVNRGQPRSCLARSRSVRSGHKVEIDDPASAPATDRSAAGQGRTGQDKACQGMVGQSRTIQGRAGQIRAWQRMAGHRKTGQDWSRQGSAGQDRAGQINKT